MGTYFIGIDSGTSGIKAVLFDRTGNEIAKKGYPLTGIFPTEDRYEEDMIEIWDKAKACIRELLAQYPDYPVVGLGITAQGDGLWLVDADGNPVRNGCCFCDGRAGGIVDRWVEDGTCEKLSGLSGTPIFSGNQNGIVKWMDENEPESLEKAAYFMHLKDYLFYKFTGAFTTDTTDQSLVFVDPVTRQYDRRMFEVCGIDQYFDKYPPLKTPEENALKIRPELAEELGLNADVVITSGPMDVAACALGSGVIENEECCSIIGTAALHEMVLDKPLQDSIQAGMTVTHMPKDRWLRLMASLAGTPNLEWMLNTIGKQIRIDAEAAGRNVYDYMEEMIQKVPIGSNGILYHPYLLAGGERAPFTDARARASYTGISVRHTLADIARATYEGVAFAMLDCYQHMPRTPKKITVCGGGANSAVWCQMFADALGSEIVTVKGEELGAKGVMLNNAVVQGYYPSYREAVQACVETDKVYQPNMENHAKYMRYYELFKLTYEQQFKTWKLRGRLIRE